MDEKRDPYMHQTSAETTSIKSQTIFLTSFFSICDTIYSNKSAIIFLFADKNDWQQRGS
jgi:predicted membrane protein